MVLILIFLSTDDRKGGGRSGGAGLDANLALETGNVERNLAKIFREKVKVFGTVQFTQVGGPAVLKFKIPSVGRSCCCYAEVDSIPTMATLHRLIFSLPSLALASSPWWSVSGWWHWAVRDCSSCSWTATTSGPPSEGSREGQAPRHRFVFAPCCVSRELILTWFPALCADHRQPAG